MAIYANEHMVDLINDEYRKVIDLKTKINTIKSNLDSIIKGYTEDYDFLAKIDSEFHECSNVDENESRESEMALLDGFICALKSLNEGI